MGQVTIIGFYAYGIPLCRYVGQYPGITLYGRVKYGRKGECKHCHRSEKRFHGLSFSKFSLQMERVSEIPAPLNHLSLRLIQDPGPANGIVKKPVCLIRIEPECIWIHFRLYGFTGHKGTSWDINYFNIAIVARTVFKYRAPSDTGKVQVG